jgi:copper chaperone CopZ
MPALLVGLLVQPTTTTAGDSTAEVTYDPAQTTPEKIAASVSKTGFAASVNSCSKATTEHDC